MTMTVIRDDAIWIKHIEGNPELQERIRALKPEQILDLEVDGVVGKWARMRDGRDGRPTYGIKPVSQMREVWKRMRAAKTGQMVPICEVVSADRYLSSLAATLDEWNSPEDTEAYRDL